MSKPTFGVSGFGAAGAGFPADDHGALGTEKPFMVVDPPAKCLYAKKPPTATTTMARMMPKMAPPDRPPEEAFGSDVGAMPPKK